MKGNSLVAIPVESRETEDFTPQSLEIMGEDAPVFRLKAPSERCRRRFRQLCGDDGLVTYSQEDFNAEKFKAIDLYWAADAAVEYRLKFVELIEKMKQGIELTPEELAWIDDLEEQLFDAHKPLRVMRRKTGEFNEFAPRYAMAVYLSGWRNLDVPMKLDAGVISQESIEAVAKALTKLGEEHSPNAPSAPFIELYIAATRRLSLTEDEEKNSPSPSQPTATPDASTTAEAAPKEKSKQSSAEPAEANPDTSSSPEASPESA
jgi:hypothetical protein